MAAFPATGGRAPPRRRRIGRPAGWTGDKRKLFLAMLGTCLNVRRAAGAVGLSCSAAYQLKRRDPDFARGWAEALDEGYANLELEMLRQAIEGWERTETTRETPDGPIRHVKIIHSYPHNVAMRLLQAHREEVLAFRHAEAERREDEDVGARVRAHMDMVRGRLIAQGIVQDDEEAMDAHDEGG